MACKKYIISKRDQKSYKVNDHWFIEYIILLCILEIQIFIHIFIKFKLSHFKIILFLYKFNFNLLTRFFFFNKKCTILI